MITLISDYQNNYFSRVCVPTYNNNNNGRDFEVDYFIMIFKYCYNVSEMNGDVDRRTINRIKYVSPRRVFELEE